MSKKEDSSRKKLKTINQILPNYNTRKSWLFSNANYYNNKMVILKH